MKIDEYIDANGIKINFVCKKSGIARDTINRIRRGQKVTEEIANRIKDSICQDLEIETLDGHVRKRSKDVAIEN